LTLRFRTARTEYATACRAPGAGPIKTVVGSSPGSGENGGEARSTLPHPGRALGQLPLRHEPLISPP
jgi:hypothetical protein